MYALFLFWFFEIVSLTFLIYEAVIKTAFNYPVVTILRLFGVIST